MRAIERQKVTSRAPRTVAPAKKSEPPFSLPAPSGESPEYTHLLFEPRSRGRARRAYAYTHGARTTCVHVRVVHATDACGPNLTKSGQMSISNVTQVGAACRRKPTQCLCASRVRTYVRTYVRAFVRACMHAHTHGPGQILSLSDCTCLLVLYRWHCISLPYFCRLSRHKSDDSKHRCMYNE